MSIKQKNIVLLISFLGLLWIAYALSFSKTVALKNQYATLKKEQELLSNVSEKILVLQQQNIYYDSILKSKKISSSSSFQHNLLQTITAFADSSNLKIVTFNTPHIFNNNNTITNTFTFTLQGSFNKIIQLIFEVEQHYKLGQITSVNFEKKKNYRRTRQYLECTILLQQLAQSD